MTCPFCQHANPTNHAFCQACGERFQFRCRHCRGLHAMDAEMCGRTGRAVPSAWKMESEPSYREFIAPLLDSFGRPLRWSALLVVALLMGLSWPRLQATPMAATSGPRVDVVFLIDSTGSMQKEIDVVKERVVSMMSSIRSGQPAPRVRFGVVTYRDRGDIYVTRKSPLTEDVQLTQQFVNNLVADGGGDILESVNEGLHVAVQGMDWDQQQSTSKLIFLIGDAGPHMDYANDYDYHQECKVAVQHGIKIHVIGCDGIDTQGLPDFQQIAMLGGGDFTYLTYRQQVTTADGRTVYQLHEGSHAYTTTTKDESWRDGASNLARAKKAELEPACEPVSRTDNNLEKVMCDKVRSAVGGAGVKY